MKFSTPLVLASTALVSSALMTASAAAATMIVDWGGNYVSESVHFDNEFDEADPGTPSGYGGFVGGNPLSLTPTAGYSGGNIYGHIQEIPGGSGFGNALSQFNGVVNNSGNDRLQLKGDDGAFPAAFLLLWNQPDFLNGAGTGTISLDATSSIRINIITYADQHATDSGRLVLRLDGGDFYISEQIFTPPSAPNDTTHTNLTDLDFFNYDPANELNVNSGDLGVAASILNGGAINGITSIGFYFESDVTTDPDAVRIQDFEVTATQLIPEPATAAALAGLLGLAAASAVRRRR